MPDKNNLNLYLPKYLSEEEKKYYRSLHRNIPAMSKNQLNLTAIGINFIDSNIIEVTSFINSTIEKKISLKPASILLLDKNRKVLSQKKEDFSDLDPLLPNSSQLYIFKFPNNNIQTLNPEQIQKWSLAFQSNLKHRVDYSDLDESIIPQSTKDYLNQIIEKLPLDNNELSFLGFSAKIDIENNLHVTLLVRNGTKDNLDIKQLPLKFYDASKELVAKGTFKIDDFTVLANTSKPLSLVFPARGILKDDLDLSNWSIVHNQ